MSLVVGLAIGGAVVVCILGFLIYHCCFTGHAAGVGGVAAKGGAARRRSLYLAAVDGWSREDDDNGSGNRDDGDSSSDGQGQDDQNSGGQSDLESKFTAGVIEALAGGTV